MFTSLRETLSSSSSGDVTVGALSKARPARVGLLVKESGVMKAWKKRFCILQGSTFYYFRDNRKDSTPAGKIDLRGATVRTAGKITGKQNSFEIRSAERTHYFVADSDKEREDWMLALHAATGVSISDSEGKRRFGGDSFREEEKGAAAQKTGGASYTFIAHAAQWLITTKGVWAQGLFCDAGISTEVEAIQRQVAEGGDAEISNMSPYSVAQALKMVLRESEPLIPHSLFLRYVAIAEGRKTDDTRQRELKLLLDDLPSNRRQTLELLMQLLRETCKRAPEEGTPARHLAVIFAPLIAPTVDLPNYFPQLSDNTLLLIQTSDTPA